ncbi:hypothetical protein LLH04_31110 (plasmid) [Pseudomonas aeruginosa]|uniref:hypothetical protein n=1 Tax=Pseudomonas aeruginosa TaxID=287 RepID=UPI001D1818AE|nr:hypothetical protein [Pseudomonas aeruginosa]UEG09202.1 hypothetical protein LLH04_31110 [Pseudomonas aeruginosa]
MFDLNTAGARQALRMQQPDEEMEVRVRYQGRIFDISSSLTRMAPNPPTPTITR